MSGFKKHLPHFNLNQTTHKGQGFTHINNNNNNIKNVHCPSSNMTANPASDRVTSEEEAAIFRQTLEGLGEDCTAYIQALNTVCSTGTLLAQRLADVFGRPTGTANHRLTPKNSKKGLFGRVKARNAVKDEDIYLTSDFDNVYYDMAEHFLKVFELLSVSTAAASSRLKTETLMSLQEVMEKMESNSDNLDESVESAKHKLLSFIELHTQFSLSGWTSTHHLSKALKMDSGMKVAVKNIQEQFDCNFAVSKMNEGDSPGMVTPYPPNCSDKDDTSLADAIDLIAFKPTEKNKKKSKKLKGLKSCPKSVINRSAEDILDSLFGEPNVSYDLPPQPMLTAINLKAQTSTWPGKVATNVVDPVKSSKTLNLDSWSLWSTNGPDFSPPFLTRTNVAADPTNCWDLFLDLENPTMSMTVPVNKSSPNTSRTTLSSNSSSFGSTTFDPFTQMNEPNMLYNNNIGEQAIPRLSTKDRPMSDFTVFRGSNRNNFNSSLVSSGNNYSSDFSINQPDRKMSFSSDNFPNHSISLMGPSPFSPDMSGRLHRQAQQPPTFPPPLLSSCFENVSSSVPQGVMSGDLRSAKTSTWPLKQVTQQPMNGASPTATQVMVAGHNWSVGIQRMEGDLRSLSHGLDFNEISNDLLSRDPWMPFDHSESAGLIPPSLTSLKPPNLERASGMSPGYRYFESNNNITVNHPCPPSTHKNY